MVHNWMWTFLLNLGNHRQVIQWGCFCLLIGKNVSVRMAMENLIKRRKERPLSVAHYHVR